MAFINRVCDKVFVINMEKDKQRLKDFDTCMKKNGIAYDRFNAINGSKVIRDNRINEYCNTFCTDGAKGCALSHRSIWDLMVENGYKNVFIFEDDAIIENDFDINFQHIWNNLPKNYDIIYYGCLFGCSDKSIVNSLYKKLSGFETESINDDIDKIRGPVGTHAYMISLEGAKKFVDKPITTAIDLQIGKWLREYNYNIYSTNLNLVYANGDNSNLADNYPSLLLGLLNKIKLTNIKHSASVGWIASENIMKIGPININPLIITLMIAVLIIPVKYYSIVYLWLFTELLVSGDFKNTFRYFFLLGIPISLKFYFQRK